MPISCLAWDTTGSALFKQPLEVGQGEEEEGEQDRADLEAALSLGGAAGPSWHQVQGPVDMLDDGKVAASLQELSSATRS